MSAALQNSRTRNRNRQQPMGGRGGYYPSYKRELPDLESASPTSRSHEETLYQDGEIAVPVFKSPLLQRPSNSSPLRGLYGDPHTAMVMCSFMGTQTSVKTRNGSTYKGNAVGFSDKGDIAMSDAKLEDDDSSPQPRLPCLIIPRESFVVCKTNGVDLKGLCSSPGEFTDSAIANRMNGASDSSLRELQPWQDDDDVPDEHSSSLSLEDSNTGWDSHSMFQANRDKFNVQSTYSEDLHEYTTKLPAPDSEGYEELQKFAQRHAEEIECSEAYQSRIAKELMDGDEELQYSAVHRGSEDGHGRRLQEANAGKHAYSGSALIGEQGMKNGTLKGQNRGPRHSSSYFVSASHAQQHPPHPHHQSLQQAVRHINNPYPGTPHSGAALGRNQGLSSLQPRQHVQQNHSAAVHAHHHHPQHPSQQYQQQPPPPPHPGIHPHHPSVSQQQQHQRPAPQQLLLPSGAPPPSKPHPPHPHPHPHPQGVPATLPSPSLPQQPPLPMQHPPPQMMAPPHPQGPGQPLPPSVVKVASMNGPAPPGYLYRQISTEGKNGLETMSRNVAQMEVSQQVYHHKPPPAATAGPPAVTAPTIGGQNVADTHLSTSPSSPSSLVDFQQVPSSGQVMVVAASPPAATTTQASDRRVGLDERNKIGQSLHDFQRNFVLESNGASCQDATRQTDTTASSSPSSTAASSSIATTPVSAAPELIAQMTDHSTATALKPEEHLPVAPKSTLNPNAKEFKPKSQSVAMEAESPSPQPRSSPHMAQILPYTPQMVLMPFTYNPQSQLNPQRKRATVSLGAGVVSDLTAHQVTGQPLLATQPASMMYIHTPGQPIPAGYQIINTRMVAPASIAIAQSGQVMGLEQTVPSQPQQVFMTAQQPVATPLPAHIHAQPTHAQALPHPAASHQVQVHVPNPAPSPVHHHHHQQQQHSSQQLSHHLSQGPSQPSTPQPGQYPQMTLSYTHGMATVSRTSSVSGQQPGMAAGHASVNLIPAAAPQFAYNGVAAPYGFSAAPQPQPAQTMPHGAGPQAHQYVVLPQPSPQGLPPVQQHAAQQHAAQQYTTAGIPFQSQYLMQGPPHMPPSHTSNPNQGSPHMIHPGMSACIQQQQQTSGAAHQPGIYMQVPALHYHQQ